VAVHDPRERKSVTIPHDRHDKLRQKTKKCGKPQGLAAQRIPFND
jgi:hypothetical protein